MNKIGFYDMKILHENARITKAGSKDWILFATTMMDEFPRLFDTAKNMDSTFHRLKNQVATGKQIVQQGIEIMNTEQVGQWAGVRSFLEQETSDYPDVPNA